MRAYLTGVCVLFAAGAAFAGDVRLVSSKGAEILGKYKPTGDTQSCLSLRQIDTMKFVEDSIIFVKSNTGDVYFNQTSNDCNGARRNTYIQYSTTGPTLCRNEIVQVIDSGSGAFMGSCSLGDFERFVEKAEG
ncbi:MAG: hypothetical protein HXY23_09905 [Parvularculaceae bacterium]|nr:hypothetical protein [Parvularculaceae bacterium]